MKKALKILIALILILGSVVWIKWPKEMTLPEYQKQNLLFKSDFDQMISAEVKMEELSEGKMYRYSESPDINNRVFGITQKIIVNGLEYRVISTYQVLSNPADAESLLTNIVTGIATLQLKF